MRGGVLQSLKAPLWGAGQLAVRMRPRAGQEASLTLPSGESAATGLGVGRLPHSMNLMSRDIGIDTQRTKWLSLRRGSTREVRR